MDGQPYCNDQGSTPVDATAAAAAADDDGDPAALAAHGAAGDAAQLSQITAPPAPPPPAMPRARSKSNLSPVADEFIPASAMSAMSAEPGYGRPDPSGALESLSLYQNHYQHHSDRHTHPHHIQYEQQFLQDFPPPMQQHRQQSHPHQSLHENQQFPPAVQWQSAPVVTQIPRGTLYRPSGLHLGTPESHAEAKRALQSGKGGNRNKVQPCPIPRPLRPNVGQRGRQVTLRANFYRLKFPDIKIHHYDVEVHPNEAAQINRKVMEVWKRLPREPRHRAIATAAVYDGRKNLFMPSELPLANETTIRGKTRMEESFMIEISEEEIVDAMGQHPKISGPQRYRLRLRKVSEIDMERLHRFLAGVTKEFPRETVMVLEVMLRHKPTMLLESGGTGGGFFTADGFTNIRGGLAIHPGWYQSIRPTAGQLLLNLDMSSTAFYQAGPLITVVSRFFHRDMIEHVRWDNPRDVQRLDKFLRDVSIEITYRSTGRRRYKIRALTPKSAIHTYISVTRNGVLAYVSVQQYFRDHYNIRLQYPHLPCVSSGAQLDIILPMELCVVRENQRHTGRLNDRQAAEMIRITALLPRQRSTRIEYGKKVMHSDSAHLAAWGVTIEPHMMEIPGRILPPPELSFQKVEELPPTPEASPVPVGEERVCETPEVGTWEVQGPLKFARGADLRYWSVAVFGDQRELPVETIQSFVLMLISAMEDKGMTIYNHRPDIVYGPAKHEVAATLALAAQRAVAPGGEEPETLPGSGLPGSSAAELVICIITQKHTIYSDIKRISETEMGLMTQCAMSRQAMKLDAGYVGNLILKLNAKLGGVNVFLDPMRQLRCLGAPTDTMILGADVTHPPPGTTEGRSIAAVVASMDSKFCEYRASIRIQGARQEIITGLCAMVCELLDLFYARAGTYPKKVIFYRDGVSEGQFTEVAIQEITALKKALKEKGVQDAKVTFLVVNKRHHVRVFPVDEGQAAAGEPVMDRKGNVLPGTVFDSDVCHPYEFDFYLTSHSGLQGTSKPAHYHVLYDENRFAADDIQELTYRLCYLYARSSRSVSIVPPAYYAHLVAARARCHAASAASVSPNTENFGAAAAAAVLGPAPKIGEGVSPQPPPLPAPAPPSRRPRKRIGVLEIARVSEELQKKMYFT
ncbi:argonaute 1 [Geranomyces variabilis]|nr:argonaute 1 [Geranomyces variabilis]